MKVVPTLILTVVAYMGALLGALVFTGNLNQKSLSKVFGGKEPMAVVEVVDEAGPLARELESRSETLKVREEALSGREERLGRRERELDDAYDRLLSLQEQIDESLAAQDSDKLARLAEVAVTVGAMNSVSAAETLELLPPEDAAEILRGVEERPRGKILNEMDLRKRAQILQLMQDSST